MQKLFKILFSIAILLSATKVMAQDVAIKTNLLGWATTTINGGVEIGLSPKSTLDLEGAYNPWTFSDDKKMKLWAAQPEYRYWLCERFEGHFFGVHAHGGQYFGGFKDWRYDGYFVGGGVSYGYSWILSPHFSLEATLGGGYAYLWYERSPRIECHRDGQNLDKHYWGITKAGISLIYNF